MGTMHQAHLAHAWCSFVLALLLPVRVVQGGHAPHVGSQSFKAVSDASLQFAVDCGLLGKLLHAGQHTTNNAATHSIQGVLCWLIADPS